MHRHHPRVYLAKQLLHPGIPACSVCAKITSRPLCFKNIERIAYLEALELERKTFPKPWKVQEMNTRLVPTKANRTQGRLQADDVFGAIMFYMRQNLIF